MLVLDLEDDDSECLDNIGRVPLIEQGACGTADCGGHVLDVSIV